MSELYGRDDFVLNVINAVDQSGSTASAAGQTNGSALDDLVMMAAVAARDGHSVAVEESFEQFSESPQLVCNGLAVTVDLMAGDLATNGDDVILGTPEADNISALAGNDTICAQAGDDIVHAGGGADWIDGGEGDDDITANAGIDVIFGGPGDDLIRGGLGADYIEGGEGDDTLLGQGGNDMLDGRSGVDGLFGGSGNDTIFTGRGATVGFWCLCIRWRRQ